MTTYDYWSIVNLVVNRNGTQFEGPAGKIQSNFINVNEPKTEVYGYFFTTESKTNRLNVSSDFAGNPRPLCPPPPPFSSPLCCNCLCQANSADVKPEWWEE